ncbi:MAG: histidine kinase [Candidatus Aminicenantes bacterium]|nr:histidine kinase [Candidatus Aminicenantes bacterium]
MIKIPREAVKKLWSRSLVLRHLLTWFLAYMAFFFSIYFIDKFDTALQIATVIIVPAPIPVYLHFFSIKHFFEKRKYTLYLISLIIIVGLSAVCFELFFNFIVNDPESHTSGIGTAIFFIVFSMGMKYFKEGLTRQHHIQEDRYKQVQTELALLKSQIHPHFFFNTLNSLYSLSLEQSQQVPNVIIELSDLMRYVLESSNKKRVPLKDEVQFIKSYISLETLRLPESADIQISVKGDLNSHSIAPMLLIPFVDNSFKHGLSSSIEDGYIHVEITMEKKHLYFRIENSKPQNEISKSKERPGVGLENVKRRILLLYPHKHELNISDSPNNFCVELKLTL